MKKSKVAMALLIVFIFVLCSFACMFAAYGSTDNKISGTSGDGRIVSASDTSEKEVSTCTYLSGTGMVFDEGTWLRVTALDSATVAVSRADATGGAVEYECIEKALEELADGDTLTLLSDISLGEDETLVFSKVNVTLDLNGKEIFNENVSGTPTLIVVSSNASLTITDSVGGGAVLGGVKVEGALTVTGGSFATDITDYVDSDSGYVTVVSRFENYGEKYSVVPIETVSEDCMAFLTYTDASGNLETIYFESFEDALRFAGVYSAEYGTESVVTLLGDVAEGVEGSSYYVSATGSEYITIDLNGHEMSADIELTGSITLTVAGNGRVFGTLSTASGAKLVVAGGTYTFDVGDLLAKDCVVLVSVEGETTLYTVLEEDEAAKRAAAFVVFGSASSNEKKTFYESFKDAVDAAGEDSTVVLCDDVTYGALVVDGAMTVDLNGHNLDADIVIYADAETKSDDEQGEVASAVAYGGGGSLKIIDSSKNASGSGSSDVGCVTGSITVYGAGDGCENDNPYVDTLVMTDGVAPNSDLEITLYLTGSYTGEEEDGKYFFGKTGDGYGIVCGVEAPDFGTDSGSEDKTSPDETEKGEEEHDLMPAIIALSVVAGVLLILGIILLFLYLTRRKIARSGDKKSMALTLVPLLLSVVPSGGVAIVIVLAVLSAAFLSVDVWLAVKIAACERGTDISAEVSQETVVAEENGFAEENVPAEEKVSAEETSSGDTAQIERYAEESAIGTTAGSDSDESYSGESDSSESYSGESDSGASESRACDSGASESGASESPDVDKTSGADPTGR